jgi:hypothetical protein
MCFACDAMSGGYDDTYDWMNDCREEDAALGAADPVREYNANEAVEDVAKAAAAWLEYLQRTRPFLFDATFEVPDEDECEEYCDECEEYYVLDVVLDLLDRGKHPLFAPLPAWMPAELARVAKVLARGDAARQPTEDQRLVFLFVHDRLAPRAEWLITENTFTSAVNALGLTSKEMAALVEQVFRPTLLSQNHHIELLNRLHTCGGAVPAAVDRAESDKSAESDDKSDDESDDAESAAESDDAESDAESAESDDGESAANSRSQSPKRSDA